MVRRCLVSWCSFQGRDFPSRFECGFTGNVLQVIVFSLQLRQQSHQIEQRSNESPGRQSQDSDLLSAIFLQLSFPRDDFTERGSFSDLLIARLNGLLNIQGFPGYHSQPQWAFTTGQSRSHNRPLGLFNSRPQRALLQANQALSIGQSGSSLRLSQVTMDTSHSQSGSVGH